MTTEIASEDHMTQSFDGFLLAYFQNGNDADSEQVRFAVTTGREPDEWTAIGGGEPVLVSDVGEGGVRDPFIARDPRTDSFVLIATDLRTYPDSDWARAVRRGSRSIVVWTSDDLVSWTPPRLAEIAPETAGNAWAPKAFWSDDREVWLVIFAATLYPEGSDRAAQEHQRLLVTETRDFEHFTAARSYLDPGHDIIDATFLEWDGEILRFTADSLTDDPETRSAFVSQERGGGLLSPDFRLVARELGSGTQARAEGPAVFTALDGQAAFLLLDEFEFRGYQLYRSTAPRDGAWQHQPAARLPEGARHGSVIPITARERERLLSLGEGGVMR